MIAYNTPSQVSSFSIFLYILFSMNILSKEKLCHWSSNSFRRISSSFFNKLKVLSVDLIKISETPKKDGLLFSIIHDRGEIDVSQLVKAYNASIVLSGDIPFGK